MAKTPNYITDRDASGGDSLHWDDMMKHVALPIRAAVRQAWEDYPETKNDLAILASAMIHTLDVTFGEVGLEALRKTRTVQAWINEATSQ